MSNSVVPAAAVVHAKQLVLNKKLAKQNVKHQPARDEQQPADKDQDEANAVQAQGALHQVSMSEVSLSGDFSFANALSDAAGSGSLVSEVTMGAAQGEGGYGDDDGGGSGGTLLLIGAVALVGLGIAVLAGGGNKNSPPAFSAASQAVTTAEDTAKAVTVTATDPDNDALTYTVTTAAGKGTVTGGTGGAFTYTPNANFNGTDSFVVTATDPDGDVTTQTVNVTVTAVADAPVVTPATQNLNGTEDTVLNGTVAATDADAGTTLTYAVSTQAGKGVAAIDSKGAFTYTPNANVNGADSFVVTVSDGALTTTQTVNVTLAAVNDAPAFSAEAVAVSVDNDAVIDSSVAALASDIDGDTLTFSLGTAATNGTAVVAADGKYTYTPNANYQGADSYTVNVADGKGGTDSLTVNVTVLDSNIAPAFATETLALTVRQDLTSTGTLAATDANEGDTLTFSVVDGPDHGELTLGAGGAYTYDPTNTYAGADTFIVRVADGRGGQDDLTVNVTVNTAGVSIDVGNPTGTGSSGIPVIFDAADGAFVFLDDASKATNVTIINFGADDVIQTTNGDATDYSYGTGDVAADLKLVFNNADAGVVNLILIEDVLGAGFVSSYQQAVNNVGHNFQTFG